MKEKQNVFFHFTKVKNEATALSGKNGCVCFFGDVVSTSKEKIARFKKLKYFCRASQKRPSFSWVN